MVDCPTRAHSSTFTADVTRNDLCRKSVNKFLQNNTKKQILHTSFVINSLHNKLESLICLSVMGCDFFWHSEGKHAMIFKSKQVKGLQKGAP